MRNLLVIPFAFAGLALTGCDPCLFDPAACRGPSPDEQFVTMVTARETDGSLASLDTANAIETASHGVSPNTAGAAARELIRAAVYNGSAPLFATACRLSNDVHEPSARLRNDLDQVDAACQVVQGGYHSPDKVCQNSIVAFQEAYRALLKGDETAARHKAAKGFSLGINCPTTTALARTPVARTSKGLILVGALQAGNAAPFIYMRGEAQPPAVGRDLQARLGGAVATASR